MLQAWTITKKNQRVMQRIVTRNELERLSNAHKKSGNKSEFPDFYTVTR